MVVLVSTKGETAFNPTELPVSSYTQFAISLVFCEEISQFRNFASVLRSRSSDRKEGNFAISLVYRETNRSRQQPYAPFLLFARLWVVLVGMSFSVYHWPC